MSDLQRPAVPFMEALERAGLDWERIPPHGNVRIYCRECGAAWQTGSTISGQTFETLLGHAKKHRGDRAVLVSLPPVEVPGGWAMQGTMRLAQRDARQVHQCYLYLRSPSGGERCIVSCWDELDGGWVPPGPAIPVELAVEVMRRIQGVLRG